MADTPTVIAETPEPKSRPYSAVLRNKRFRALWMSQFVSGLGDWLVIGLLIPLVTTLTDGSSFAVAGIMIAKMVPSLLFSSVIGVFVDRFDRRRLMIACDLVRALLTLFLLFTNSLAVIYMTVLLMEIASLFFSPARSALIPRLVAEEEVAVANGLAYTTQQASMLIGLTMSGAILAGFEAIVRWVLASGLPFVDVLVGPFAPALLGSRAGVVLNSLTFIVSATLLWSIRVRVRPDRDGGGFQLSLIGKDALESFRFLGGHKELRGLLVTIGMAILGGGAIITVGLTYVQGILAEGIPILEQFEAIQRLIAAPQTFVLVLLALGMVTGAIIVPRLASRIPLQALFLGAVTVFGVSMLVFASVGVYWVSIIFGFTAGFCIACLTVAGNTYVAQTVSDDIRGRVFTAMESVIRVSLLLSMVVVAPLADLLATLIRKLSEGMTDPSWFTGPRVTLLIASLIVLGAAYYAYRTLDWRQADHVNGGAVVTADE
ncbi:MAG: MFS transporter [Coriobacteriia bacterium]|nr:MFS transporter [Coriobacteriia bacterium]